MEHHTVYKCVATDKTFQWKGKCHHWGWENRLHPPAHHWWSNVRDEAVSTSLESGLEHWCWAGYSAPGRVAISFSSFPPSNSPNVWKDEHHLSTVHVFLVNFVWRRTQKSPLTLSWICQDGVGGKAPTWLHDRQKHCFSFLPTEVPDSVWWSTNGCPSDRWLALRMWWLVLFTGRLRR